MIIEVKRTKTGFKAIAKGYKEKYTKVSKLYKIDDWHSPIGRAVSEVVGDKFNLQGINFNSCFSENKDIEVSQFYITSTGIILFRIESKKDKE